MTFATKIQLAKYTPPKGSVSAVDKVTGEVWAKVTQPGVTVQYSAMTANRKASMQAIMWRGEYNGENRAIIGDKTYRIEDTGPADNDLHIKLMLAREG